VKELVDKILNTNMYRGARGGGDPTVLRGPIYFSSSEAFARTYGPTAAFRLTLKKPLLVSEDDWHQYASSLFNPLSEIVKNVRANKNDSVVNIRFTPAGHEMITVLLLNPRQAVELES